MHNICALLLRMQVDTPDTTGMSDTEILLVVLGGQAYL